MAAFEVSVAFDRKSNGFLGRQTTFGRPLSAVPDFFR
jgi:hypothetical protein